MHVGKVKYVYIDAFDIFSSDIFILFIYNSRIKVLQRVHMESLYDRKHLLHSSHY